MVGHEDGDLKILSPALNGLAGEVLQLLLQGQIKRQVVLGGGGGLKPGTVGEVRGEGREGFAQAGDGFGKGGLRFFGVDQVKGDSAGQDAVAGIFGPVGGSVGAAGLGALRDGDQ